MRNLGRRQRKLGATLCALLVVAAVLPPRQTAGAAPAIPTVGVVDFYAISPVAPIVGVIAERFSADDLSTMLARAGTERLTVLPRAAVQQAEREEGWRNADVLRYARLRSLAERLHADRLVVGWIRQLIVNTDSDGGAFPKLGGGPIMASAVLVVQVFDAAGGRIVSEMQTEGEAIGSVRPILTEIVLHRALEPAIAHTVDALTAPAP